MLHPTPAEPMVSVMPALEVVQVVHVVSVVSLVPMVFMVPMVAVMHLVPVVCVEREDCRESGTSALRGESIGLLRTHSVISILFRSWSGGVKAFITCSCDDLFRRGSHRVSLSSCGCQWYTTRLASKTTRRSIVSASLQFSP